MPETIEEPGSVEELPALIKAQGYSKVLIVTDQVLYRKLHLMDKLVDALLKEGIIFTVYDRVQPNPTGINVEEGVALLKEYHCEAIIAFGGGSPMDCAKGIGAVAVKNKPVSKLQGLFKVLHKIPPIFAVLTTAGTGSETSVVAVITDAGTHHKASMNDVILRAQDSIFPSDKSAKSSCSANAQNV